MSTGNAIVDVGTPSTNPYPEWETTYVRFNDFENLSFVTSPEFMSCGQKWILYLSPEGWFESIPGMMSIFIVSTTDEEPVKVRYSFTIKDHDGKVIAFYHSQCEFEESVYRDDEREAVGKASFVEKSKITDYVLQNGSLVIEVRLMRLNGTGAIEKTTPTTPLFVPENPSACRTIQKMFMNEKTSDVVFEVGEAEPKRNSRKKAKKNPPSIFYAHRVILEQCSTTLSDLCASSESIIDDDTGRYTLAPIQIADVNADMFFNILYYIYGGEISTEFMKSNFKEIIEASDKYGVSNLKLVAEAFYVESTTITTENLMEHLLYADSKNCALLKETVMDFIAENDAEVLQKVSFTDLPGGATMFTDILTSVARRNREEDDDSGDDDSDDEAKLTTLKVCDLRRKAHEKGLGIDGSRETLIASLKGSS